MTRFPEPDLESEARELPGWLYDRLLAKAQAFSTSPAALAYDPDSDVLSPLKDGRYGDMCRLAQDALKRGRFGHHPRIRLFVADAVRGDLIEAELQGTDERFHACARDESWIRPGARTRPSALAGGR